MSDAAQKFALESWQAQARCMERRNRVFRYPDLAAKLCEPPFSLPDPRFWSGYIPAAEHMEQPNNSPIRHQLVAICNMVKAREDEEERADATADVAPPLIDEKGLTALHAAFTDAHIILRDDKLLYCQSVIGHAVESTKDLTAEEAYLCRQQLWRLIRSEESQNAPQTDMHVEDVPAQDQLPDATDDGPDYDETADPSLSSGWDSWGGTTGRGDEPPY
jgi:hypothetical protein